jgi:hypothetical protein
MRAIVVTADQHGSRRGPDRVPELLDALEALGEQATGLAFERTAGDEVQGLLVSPTQVSPVLECLLRAGHWTVGLGVGEVETPLPARAREGRGPAYVAARDAVTAAKHAPWSLRVQSSDPAQEDRALESALWLWAALLSRRTARGWEVVDLVDRGATYEQAARQLGIGQSAVSQRAKAAGLAEGRRARELVTHLAVGLLGQDAGS